MSIEHTVLPLTTEQIHALSVQSKLMMQDGDLFFLQDHASLKNVIRLAKMIEDSAKLRKQRTD